MQKLKEREKRKTQLTCIRGNIEKRKKLVVDHNKSKWLAFNIFHCCLRKDSNKENIKKKVASRMQSEAFLHQETLRKSA